MSPGAEKGSVHHLATMGQVCLLRSHTIPRPFSPGHLDVVGRGAKLSPVLFQSNVVDHICTWSSPKSPPLCRTALRSLPRKSRSPVPRDVFVKKCTGIPCTASAEVPDAAKNPWHLKAYRDCFRRCTNKEVYQVFMRVQGARTRT